MTNSSVKFGMVYEFGEYLGSNVQNVQYINFQEPNF